MPVQNSKTIIAGFSLAVCLGLCSIAVFADDEGQEKALKEVRAKIERLRDDIQKTQTQHDAVRTELAGIEKDINQIHRVIKQLDWNLLKQKQKLSTLFVRRTQLRKDVATQQYLLEKQISAAYMIGRQEYIKLILNQEDPAVIGRTMAYYDYFNRARVERIDGSRKSLTALIETEKQIKAETESLKSIQEQKLAKKEKLHEASSSRGLVVAKLQQELRGKESDLSQLLADEKRLSDLVTRLDEAIPDILIDSAKHTPFAKLKGKLNWPTKGKVQALFGQHRQSSRARWSGVMIRADEGHDVRAVSHGRIAYADWLRGYGLLLIIDHGNGYMSLYGHNQTIYKETGEWVEAGETIASVGKSGGQEQAGLYFEIRHNGKPANPVDWCRHG